MEVEFLGKIIVTKCQSVAQFATLLDDIPNGTIMNWT